PAPRPPSTRASPTPAGRGVQAISSPISGVHILLLSNGIGCPRGSTAFPPGECDDRGPTLHLSLRSPARTMKMSEATAGREGRTAFLLLRPWTHLSIAA